MRDVEEAALAETRRDLPDAGAPEVPVFARAILIGHQRDALAYLDMRIAAFIEQRGTTTTPPSGRR